MPYPGLRMEDGNVWQIMASYAVTYDANQATGGIVPDPQVKFHDESLTLSHNTGNLVRTGYNFAGWNTQANGNGTDYAEGVTYTVNSSVTLYAKWTAIISVSARPPSSGEIFGSGTYAQGSNITVRAEANPGYVFSHWTEDSTVVSCDTQYSFTVTGNRTLQANFSQVQSQYTITGTASPRNFGTVTGSGSYNHDVIVTMTALPNQGFALTNWIETWPDLTGYCVVSNDEQYSFTATMDRELTANIRPQALPGTMMLLLDDE